MDPTRGSTHDLGTGGTTVTIDLAKGETVIVSFTNKQRGSITVVKDADPDDAQDFTYSGDLGAFTLDDDGGVDGTYLNTKVFENILRGQVYNITEASVTGWDLSSITISGDDDYTTGSGNTATVYVDPGEDITITFTNIMSP